MAATTVKAAVWLLRHPLVTVLLVLAIVGVAGFGVASLTSSGSASPAVTSRSLYGTAESTLPAPTQVPPKPRVEETHRALHAMGRACKAASIADRAAVRAPVVVMEQFARDFPNAGFSIDGEPGTTLSLLVVLRSELQDCDPALVPGVDRLLPQRFRDPS